MRAVKTTWSPARHAAGPAPKRWMLSPGPSSGSTGDPSRCLVSRICPAISFPYPETVGNIAGADAVADT